MSIPVDHGRGRLPGATVSIPFAVPWQRCATSSARIRPYGAVSRRMRASG